MIFKLFYEILLYDEIRTADFVSVGHYQRKPTQLEACDFLPETFQSKQTPTPGSHALLQLCCVTSMHVHLAANHRQNKLPAVICIQRGGRWRACGLWVPVLC